MKNKGFTLIELLAVIIILGLLMLIAIPSVTNYINESRKSAYIDTALQYVKGATNLVNSGNLDIFDTETTYYIPSSCISLESGGESPYGGKFTPAYILVTYDNNSYNYYWMSRDDQNMGIKSPVLSTNLKKEDISSGVKEQDVSVKYGIDGRDNLIEFDEDCISQKEAVPSTEPLNSDGESIKTDLKLGDYVRMVPDSSTYTVTTDITGYSSDQTITPNEITLWRVISINKNGTVDLVADNVSSTQIKFIGTRGYANFIGGLQTISQQYAKAGYTVSTRIIGYDGQTLTINDTSAFDGSNNEAPTKTGTGYPQTGTGVENQGGVLGDTLYLKDYLLLNNVYHTLEAKVAGSGARGVYWLASRKYDYFENSSVHLFWFSGRIVYETAFSYNEITYFNGYHYANGINEAAIRPIITIKAGLKIASGQGSKQNPYELTK